MRNLQISLLPYAKMILHALKYPHCAVVGLLVGKEVGSWTFAQAFSTQNIC